MFPSGSSPVRTAGPAGSLPACRSLLGGWCPGWSCLGPVGVESGADAFSCGFVAFDDADYRYRVLVEGVRELAGASVAPVGMLGVGSVPDGGDRLVEGLRRAQRLDGDPPSVFDSPFWPDSYVRFLVVEVKVEARFGIHILG